MVAGKRNSNKVFLPMEGVLPDVLSNLPPTPAFIRRGCMTCYVGTIDLPIGRLAPTGKGRVLNVITIC
jgi:hypothetical protein